jgi:hypothetical protein
MRGAFLIIIILFTISLPAAAETIYVYLEESCNGENGIYLSEIKEGIFDAFFEAGHIVFDNIRDKGSKTYVKNKDFSMPLKAAVKGGAGYLLAVGVESKVDKINENTEKISSSAQVYLLQTSTGEIIYSGKVELCNSGKEDLLTKDKLGFELGVMITALLDNHFN